MVFLFTLLFVIADTLFHLAGYTLLVEPAELQASALGKATYFAFNLTGWPPRFGYPNNAAEVGRSGGRNKPPTESFAYAIIKACLVGTKVAGEDEPVFFKFEKVAWGQCCLAFHYPLGRR